MRLGTPHLHLSTVDSTSDRARELAIDGAPNGTTVTAEEQTAGRGRRGRSWSAPPGQALLMSVVLRSAPELLTLRAAVATANACGGDPQIKWPNDIVLGGRKVAGILCEQRPGEDWTIVGIGVNVAVDLDRLDPELRETAGTLGRTPMEISAVQADLLAELDAALELPDQAVIDAWSARDALWSHTVAWSGGTGKALGIDGEGHLLIGTENDGQIALDSGEVSLVRRV